MRAKVRKYPAKVRKSGFLNCCNLGHVKKLAQIDGTPIDDWSYPELEKTKPCHTDARSLHIVMSVSTCYIRHDKVTHELLRNNLMTLCRIHSYVMVVAQR